MPITEDEAASLIDHIERTVREAALAQDKPRILELISQWRADVEAGRPVERKLPVRQSPGIDAIADVPRSRMTSSGDFVGKEDFSSIEQLDMLITALGVTFVAPQMMATRFLDVIGVLSSGPTAKAQHDPVVRLVSEIDVADIEKAPLVSRSSIEQSIAHTQWLGKLLAEIVEEAGYEPRRLADVEAIA